MITELEDRLVDVKGTFFEAVEQVNCETIQHSDQIAKARTNTPSLWDQEHWVGDFPMCTLEDDEIVLYLGRLEVNPMILNPSVALNQIIEKGVYIPSDGEIKRVKESKRTTRISLIDITEQYCGFKNECMYFEFRTSKDQPYFSENQWSIAKRAFGSGNDFERYMEFLADNEISSTGVHFMSPSLARELLKYNQALGLMAYINKSAFFIIPPSIKDIMWMRAVELTKRI